MVKSNTLRKVLGLFVAAAIIFSGVFTQVISSINADAAAEGFYVSGTTLYDANGNQFVMRGVNIAHAWYTDKTEASIKAAADLGANTVRIVLSDGGQYTKTTSTEVEQIIEWCKENKVVCILEVHDATGSDNTSDLTRAVNYWIDIKNILNENRKYVLVNIANEWYGTWDGSAWADGYTSAIQSLRNAGIKNTIIVDCGGWGQYPASIHNYGNTVFNADSEANTIFSIHMYEYSGGDSTTVTNNIDGVLNNNLPLIIGEFGNYHSNGDVDEDTIMSYCTSKNVGYLGWSWKGNGGGVEYLDLVNDWEGTSLTDWGNTLFNSTYGIKNTSSICSIYGDSSSSGDNSSENSLTIPLNPKTVWLDEQKFESWENNVALTTTDVAKFKEGDVITVNFTQNTTGAQVQLQTGGWGNIYFAEAESWGGNSLSSGVTSISYTVTADIAQQLTATENRILIVKGINITVTSIVITPAPIVLKENKVYSQQTPVTNNVKAVRFLQLISRDAADAAESVTYTVTNASASTQVSNSKCYLSITASGEVLTAPEGYVFVAVALKDVPGDLTITGTNPTLKCAITLNQAE